MQKMFPQPMFRVRTHDSANNVSELAFCGNFPTQLPQLRKQDASGNNQI